MNHNLALILRTEVALANLPPAFYIKQRLLQTYANLTNASINGHKDMRDAYAEEAAILYNMQINTIEKEWVNL